MTQNNRYQRQTVLPEIGPEGQEKLSKASVLCVGAGGLGCPALLYLAAAGVGRIGIIDFDSVDETNLQRQVLYTVDQIGQNKAQAARDKLLALNPGIEIYALTDELNDKNASDLFADYDLVIDGTDNFATKFLINDAALKTGTLYIYGSILGFEGQLAVFGAPGGPCYRCLFPEPPTMHVPNCAEAGVIGAVAGLIGTAQAMEAIKIIVGHASLRPLSEKLWTIDLRTMESKTLNLPKNPDCTFCNGQGEDTPLQYASPVCGIIPEVTAQQAKEQKQSLLIDVREEDEWNAGHIDGAQHAPLSHLMQGVVPDLPTDSDIILYCQKGPRGEMAGQIFRAKGHLNISNMAGGYAAWLKCS